ncbi:MAG: hypothetical protein HYT87_00020 [Nitrospirae bacterium]|nr:hypothetical protein [Nitrospirota bacterium]
MITFSDYDLQPIVEGKDWQVDFVLHGSIMSIAVALGMFWIVYAAIAWAQGNHPKAIYRVLTIAFAVAITVAAEQAGSPAGSAVFGQIAKVADGLPMGLIQARDAKISAGFFDSAEQFPLARRLRDDFAGELTSSTATPVRTFATECMSKPVHEKLSDATYADAVTEVGGRSIRLSGADKNCKNLNTEIGVAAAQDKGTRSYFSMRRAESRVSAAALFLEQPPAAPSERLQRLLASEIPAKDEIGVQEAGSLHGEVTEGFIKSFVAAPLFVLLPGGLWNLGIYTLGFLSARTITGYSAFKLHQKELACIKRLDALDAQDALLEPLHAHESYFVKGGVDKRYVETLEGCVRSKRTTRVLEWMGLGLTGALILVAWWKAGG